MPRRTKRKEITVLCGSIFPVCCSEMWMLYNPLWTVTKLEIKHKVKASALEMGKLCGPDESPDQSMRLTDMQREDAQQRLGLAG